MRATTNATLDRRRMLQASALSGGIGLIGLGGCATAAGQGSAPISAGRLRDGPPIYPIHASPDRIFDYGDGVS